MKFSTQGKTCFRYREPLFSLQGPLLSLQGFPCEKTSQETPVFITGNGFAVQPILLVDQQINLMIQGVAGTSMLPITDQFNSKIGSTSTLCTMACRSVCRQHCRRLTADRQQQRCVGCMAIVQQVGVHGQEGGGVRGLS